MADNFNMGSKSVARAANTFSNNLDFNSPAYPDDSIYAQGNNNSLTKPISDLNKPNPSALFKNLDTTEEGRKALDAAAAKQAKADQLEAQRKAALITGGLQAVSSVMQAETQYEAVAGAANTNIKLLNYNRSLAIAAGRQAALDRQMEGEMMADNAALTLAAQGQSLNSAGAEKVLSSYRAMALNNAMLEEVKMYSDIAGIDFQIANIDYEVDMARNNADTALRQGIFNTAGSIAGYYRKVRR